MAGKKTRKIILDYQPQKYQLEIHRSSKRFRTAVIGRRGGKTVLAINELIKQAVTQPGLYWFIAPSYRQAKSIGWATLKRFLEPDKDWKFNEMELKAYHPVIKTTIELKGADNEDSLRGVGIQGCVLDECATMKANVWPEIIRPMLADTGGRAMFIGTPRGKNWFYDIFKTQDEDWQSWQYPTTINRYIKPEEIEASKRDMPQDAFHQEILAEFLDDSAQVFRRIRSCVHGQMQEPIKGERYVIGADVAKHKDYTVLIVMEEKSRSIVHFERFQSVSWPEQKERIQRLSDRYNYAELVLDSTGIGDVLYDDLQDAGVSVTPVKFTNESKKQLIERLVMAIEKRIITYPEIPVLLDELERFEYIITSNGTVKYGAPEGYHDDAVISLALAVHGLRSEMFSAKVIAERMEPVLVDRQGQGEVVGVREQPDYEFSGY